MKRYKVIVTGQAKEDIRDIKNYIAKKLHEPHTAERVLVRLLREVDSLEVMPERCALADDAYLAEQGYRAAKAGNYLLFYTVDHDAQTVRIARVVHGSRDWAELMQQDE